MSSQRSTARPTPTPGTLQAILDGLGASGWPVLFPAHPAHVLTHCRGEAARSAIGHADAAAVVPGDAHAGARCARSRYGLGRGAARGVLARNALRYAAPYDRVAAHVGRRVEPVGGSISSRAGRTHLPRTVRASLGVPKRPADTRRSRSHRPNAHRRFVAVTDLGTPHGSASMITFSVLLTTYNSSATIGRCLASIFGRGGCGRAVRVGRVGRRRLLDRRHALGRRPVARRDGSAVALEHRRTQRGPKRGPPSVPRRLHLHRRSR